jgi:hypothetical protein
MAECETSRALHNGSVTSRTIGAAPGGPLPAKKAAPTPAPIAPHGHTLQFLISIIKDSQRRSPLQHNG